MSHAGHNILICRTHKVKVGQCRCLSPNKLEQLVQCPGPNCPGQPKAYVGYKVFTRAGTTDNPHYHFPRSADLPVRGVTAMAACGPSLLEAADSRAFMPAVSVPPDQRCHRRGCAKLYAELDTP